MSTSGHCSRSTTSRTWRPRAWQTFLIPGEDEESDDAPSRRYFESLESQAFGGNIADYKNKVELLPGVGA